MSFEPPPPLLIELTRERFDFAQQTSFFDAVLQWPVELYQLPTLPEAARLLQP